MHPKVAEAIQEIDAALFHGDTFDDPDDRAELRVYVERWMKELESSESIFGVIKHMGSWADADGVVHAVNATQVHPDIDLGRETACESVAWDPDNPRSYPVTIGAVVDCMTCIVRQVRLCP